MHIRAFLYLPFTHFYDWYQSQYKIILSIWDGSQILKI